MAPYLLVLILLNTLTGETTKLGEVNKTLAECVVSAQAIVQATMNSNRVIALHCDALPPPPDSNQPKPDEKSF